MLCNDKDNPIRGYNNCEYLFIQNVSTEVNKVTINSHKERNWIIK